MLALPAVARAAARRVAAGGAAAVFALALLVRGTNWGWLGTRISPDGVSYLSGCAAWAADPVAKLQSWIGIETATFTLPLCTVTAWLGLPVSAWVFLQVVASAAACTLLFSALRILAGTRAAWLGGLGLAVLWELAQWDAYVLTESLFVFDLALGIWTFARWTERPARGREWAFYGALALLAMVRAVGLLIAVGWLAGFLVHRVRGSTGEARRAALRTAAAVGVVGLALTAAWLGTSGRLEDYTERSALVDIWAAGTVVHDDPTWDHVYEPDAASGTLGFLFANLEHVAWLAFLKGALLFLPFAPRFSTPHVLLNLVTLVPLFLLGGLGIARAARERAPLLWLWLVPVAATLAQVMVTFIDYDWRYRVPILLPFVALSASWLARQPLAQAAMDRAAAWASAASAESPDRPATDAPAEEVR